MLFRSMSAVHGAMVQEAQKLLESGPGLGGEPRTPDQGAENSREAVGVPLLPGRIYVARVDLRTARAESWLIPGKLGAVPVRALWDTGAGLMAVSQQLVTRHKLTTHKTTDAIEVVLANGTKVLCTEVVRAPLRLGGHVDSGWEFYVIPLAADYDVIMGMPWNIFHKPAVDWEAGTLTILTPKGSVSLRSRKCTPLATLLSAAGWKRALHRDQIDHAWLVHVHS